MGIRDAITDGRWKNVDLDDLTVDQLVGIYGEEVVRRGLSYMDSLKEADENYRKAGGEQSDKYAKETAEGMMGEAPEEPTEGMEEAGSKWASAMNESGLGISDGDAGES